MGNCQCLQREVISTSTTDVAFQTFDYNEVDDQVFPQTFQSWRDAIKTLTNDKVVVAQHLHKTALKALKDVGPIVKGLRVGKNRGLFHRFITMELQGKDDVEDKCFVFFEKGPMGILFQIGDDLETVRQNRCGDDRGKVDEVESTTSQGFKGILVNNLMQIGSILDHWDFYNLYYGLALCNCQHFTTEFQAQLLKASFNVQLKVPGSEELPFTSDKILPCIDKMYPKWKENKVSLFPEEQKHFALMTSEPPTVMIREDDDESEKARKQKVLDDYNVSVAKQIVMDAFCAIMQQEDYSSCRKAVFSKLTREGIEKTFEDDHPGVTPTLAKMISFIWSRYLELLVIVEGIGAIVFHFFTQGNASEASLKEMDERRKLLQQIQKFPSEAKCFHSISVCLDAQSSYISGPRQRTSTKGSHLTLHLNKDILQNAEELQKLLLQCIKKLPAISRKCEIINELLLQLTAKIILLQNVQSEKILIHSQLDTQQWGAIGITLWIQNQKEVLDDPRLHLLVDGCQGSGNDSRTLIMIEKCKRFAEDNPPSDLQPFRGFMMVHDDFPLLQQQLKDHIAADDIMKGRFDVGAHPLPGVDLASYSLVVVDEMDINHEEFFPAHLPFYNKLSPEQTIIMFASRTRVTSENLNKALYAIGKIFHFESHSLDGNLRSSAQISKMAADFQQKVVGSIGNIRVTSKLDFGASSPQIKVIDDASEQREDLLAAAEETFAQISKGSRNKEVLVCCVSHLLLRRRIEARLREKFSSPEYKVTFGDALDVLGCQFHTVFVIVDVATCIPTAARITDIITRATMSLNFLVNKTLVPFQINGQPCCKNESCPPSNLIRHLTSLSASEPNSGKKVFVNDEFDFLPASDRQNMTDEFDFDWCSTGSLEVKRQRTEEASYVIQLMPPEKFSTYSVLSFAPFLQLKVGEKTKLMRRNDDYDSKRKTINTFFEGRPSQ